MPAGLLNFNLAAPAVVTSSWKRTTASGSLPFQTTSFGKSATGRSPDALEYIGDQANGVPASAAAASRVRRARFMFAGVGSIHCQRRTTRAFDGAYGPSLPSSERNRARSANSCLVSGSVSDSGISDFV